MLLWISLLLEMTKHFRNQHAAVWYIETGSGILWYNGIKEVMVSAATREETLSSL